MKTTTQLVPALFAALVLAGCGESIESAKKMAAEETKQFVDETKVADLLTAEAKFAMGTLEQDVRKEIAAYQAQFGKLPTSFAELKSLATPTALATTAVTDALAEQLPFVRRETLEQVATRFVTATEKRIFDQVVAQEAAPVGNSGAQ